MLVSNSDGLCLEGLVAAILLMAAMLALLSSFVLEERWKGVFEDELHDVAAVVPLSFNSVCQDSVN